MISSPAGQSLAAGAGSMMRVSGTFGTGGNIAAGMAGGVTGAAIRTMTGSTVATSSVTGAMIGSVAGGALNVSTILGTGAAGAAAGVAGLATKSYVDGLVDSHCREKCSH
jgi:hypothetical protein